MKKRLISIAVVLSIVASMLTFNMYSSAATADTNVNKILLDNLLSDRSWVIDTLINDDYSKNPHAIVGAVSSQDSMMARALSQYGNADDPNYSPAYKIMVDALTLWYNKGDYAADVVDGVTEWSADALETFGTAEGAQDALRNCADNAKNMQYDNILQEVIKADYTATNGKTLSGSNSQLIMLRKINDGATALKNLASAAKDVSGLDYETALSTTDYINTVLNPASESYEKAISSLGEALGAESGERETALLEFSTFLGRVLVYDSIVISPSESGKVATFAPTYLLDETTKEIIDVNSNIADFASSTIDGYMYIKSIQTQKESVSGVMTRAASNTSNAGTKTVLNRYADLIEDAADGKTANYKYVISTLRQSGVLNKYVEKKASEAAKDVVKRLIPCYENSIAPDVFASVTGVVGTATYLADAVTGLKDTCTKTVELKNLNEIINLFVKTYKQDLANYKSNPTDENAAKVIDDLEFIQRLRLRGETIAYGMTRAQFTSLLGRLLSGGNYSAVSSLDYDYQAHIDALIGASVTPFTTDSFTVKNGETVTIATHDKGFLYGVSRSEKGTPVLFAEPEYRMMNGVTVQSGGTLNVAVQRVATPHIVNNGGTVVLGCNNLNEYTQTGGNLTLGVNVNTIREVYLSGGTVKSSSSASLNCEIFSMSESVVVSDLDVITDKCNISNAWDLGNSSLTVNDESNISGSISGGTVNIKGDFTGGGGNVENLYVSGSGNQNLSGTLNVTNLIYNNTGIAKQSGTIYVSGTVKNTSSKVNNGQNTVLKSTGSIIGDHYNSGLALDGVTLNKAISFNGTLKTQNTVNLDDVNITGGLTQSNGILNLNGDVTVTADSYFGGTVIQGENDYITKGDISGSTITLGNLNMCGNIVQTISNAVTTNDFYNNNSKGLNINAKVTVNGKVKSVKAPVNGQNVTLQETAGFEDSPYYGDVTVNGMTGSFPAYVYGKVYLQGDVAQTSDTSINNLTFSKGTLSLQNADMTIKGILNNTATSTYITLDDTSTLTLKGDTVISGSVTGTGSFVTYGDITNNGTINVENLTLTANAPVTINGSTITTSNLTTNGKSKINLSSQINVLQGYTENNHNIDSSKVVYSQGNVITNNVTYDTLLNVTGDLLIDGHTVNAKKGLTLKNGDIILTNGAKLIVNGKASITGTSSYGITVDETSSIEFNKLAIINTLSSVEVNGSLKFGSDVSLSSTTITGNGTISLWGDLYCSSVTINQPHTFKVVGKTPQTISASGANFKNLYISNPSRGGVSFSSSVNCYGEYNTNDSNVSGTVTQK